MFLLVHCRQRIDILLSITPNYNIFIYKYWCGNPRRETNASMHSDAHQPMLQVAALPVLAVSRV